MDHEIQTYTLDVVNEPEVIVRRPLWTSRPQYYRCDWETYFKLKQLKRWFWQTVYGRAKFVRWNNKLPPNRRGPEPDYYPGFEWSRFHDGLDDGGILTLFEDARRPSDEPVTLLAKLHPYTYPEINKKYEAACAWFVANGEEDPFVRHERKKSERQSRQLSHV